MGGENTAELGPVTLPVQLSTQDGEAHWRSARHTSREDLGETLEGQEVAARQEVEAGGHTAQRTLGISLGCEESRDQEQGGLDQALGLEISDCVGPGELSQLSAV